MVNELREGGREGGITVFGFGPPNREKKKTDDAVNSEELGTIKSTYRVPVPYLTGGFIKTVFLFVPLVRWGLFLALHSLCLLKYPFGEPPLKNSKQTKHCMHVFSFPLFVSLQCMVWYLVLYITLYVLAVVLDKVDILTTITMK
jgi:hypothetical protein